MIKYSLAAHFSRIIAIDNNILVLTQYSWQDKQLQINVIYQFAPLAGRS